MPSLKEKLKNIPHKPGVYKFLGHAGNVIYVGKAKDLRSRVAQYFGRHDDRPQLPYLMADAVDLDYIVVNSELESLFLENTLIKQYMPEYNIMLRDDKNYAFIKIDYTTQIPQIGYARKVENPSTGPERTVAKYFGPYSSTKKIKDTLDFVRKIFPYCASAKVGNRPCFYYHLHRCPGVCVGAITLPEYGQQIDRISLFLSGKTSEVRRNLKINMKTASGKRNFELAARLRDQLQAILVLDERQIAMFPKKVNWDFISFYIENQNACVNLFKVRDGRLIDKESFLLGATGKGEITQPEILQRFSETYYAENTDLPKEIYLQNSLSNPALLSMLLQSRSKTKIKLSVPTRGKKLQLSKLGATNAKEFLKRWLAGQANNLDAIKSALEQLKKILNLPNIPRRIEGYDISNIQGSYPVGSMVVIKDGTAAKSEYRRFKINLKQTPDDFAMMKEMLERRLTRLESTDKNKWPKPDLMVIDGGKGQLSVAVGVLKKYKLNIPVVGLAKRIEEIFVPGRSKPIILSHDKPELQMLQRLRDEAHRFGITFHRSLRSKAAVRSALDDIPGLGPKTKKLLKEKIGTVAQIRQAPIEKLSKLIGQQKAEQLKKYL